MTLSLSPISRRIVALALVAIAGLLALTLVQSLLSVTGGALDSLEDARMRAARVEAMRERPTPPEPTPLPAGLYVQAPNHRAASVLAARRIQAGAAIAELAVQNLTLSGPDGSNPNLIRVAFALEGPETKVLNFIGDLERGLPAIRLREWRIERIDGPAPALRVEATAVAAWEGTR